MNTPVVSVILPTYNQLDFLPMAVESVMNQTYRDWELIIVNDGSVDGTKDYLEHLQGQRVKVIHNNNQGLPVARNSGIKSAKGKYLTFLDGDDLFESTKLERQVEHLESSKAAGLSYGARIEINRTGEVLGLIRGPKRISPSDLILYFPFTINDILVRRWWVDRVGGFDKDYSLHGEDRKFYTDLAIEGCEFEGIDHVTSCRRLHLNRKFDQLQERHDLMIRCVEEAYARSDGLFDRRIRNEAFARIHKSWGIQALLQGKHKLGLHYFKLAGNLDPSLLNRTEIMIRQLLWSMIRLGKVDESMLRDILNDLPIFHDLSVAEKEAIVGEAYLRRGVRDLTWNRKPSAEEHLTIASRIGARPENALIEGEVSQIIDIEAVIGPSEAQAAIENIREGLKAFNFHGLAHQLVGRWGFNRAFNAYEAGQPQLVVKRVQESLKGDPTLVFNRGLISITIRSLLAMSPVPFPQKT